MGLISQWLERERAWRAIRKIAQDAPGPDCTIGTPQGVPCPHCNKLLATRRMVPCDGLGSVECPVCKQTVFLKYDCEPVVWAFPTPKERSDVFG